MMKWINDNVGFFTIIAIVLAPILTLQIQKVIEDYKEIKNRKFFIFKTLMATRANTVSDEHVRALNMIDIEFYQQNKIRDSWDIYRDHLNSKPALDDYSQKRWEETRFDYLADMLNEMSKFFKYDFNKLIIKKGSYIPIANGILNTEGAIIRKSLVKILTGDDSLKISLTNNKNPVESKEKVEV